MDKVVAVWDIGKTNVKLSAVSLADGKVLSEVRQAVVARAGPPYLHLDVDGLWDWVIGALARLASKTEVAYLVVAAHGATCALVDDAGLVLPILDYEDMGPEEIEAQYAAHWRPPFAETYSPALPGSLNFGKGLFWLSHRFADEFARTKYILNYAQYWSWRLSGIAANEVCSIGSHSDLWKPRGADFSSLVGKLGWNGLFPPLRRADETLGTITSPVADATGLPANCEVLCGIHDSNASLVPWLGGTLPFTVSSTGTWVINLAIGADLECLQSTRDCAANVTMHGAPVASSRWMGGREYAHLTAGVTTVASAADVRTCLEHELMFLPPQGGQGGPFPGIAVADTQLPDATRGQRVAAASLYCALLLDVCLDLCSSTDTLIVEGPFARNNVLLQALAGLRKNQQVLCSEDPTGTTAGAARLVLADLPAPVTRAVAAGLDADLLATYCARWQSLLPVLPS